jgi:hypothetical protein
MATFWLPGELGHQLETEKYGKAEAQRIEDFARRLQALDPRLGCFIATETRDGLKEGYWYIIRQNDIGPTTWEVSNPDGSFREPDERDIEALRQLDLHNPARVREFRERRQRALREKESRVKAMEEVRQAHADEYLTFHTRTQIPFNHPVRPKRAA